jgi:hydroxylamine reductase
MSCNQCQQTKNNTGCDIAGVCGKTPTQSGLQDLIGHYNYGIALWACKFNMEEIPRDIKFHFVKSTFACLTNVNFHDNQL